MRGLANRVDTRHFRVRAVRRRVPVLKGITSSMISLFRYILVAGISFVILYPLLVRFSASLMQESDLYDLTVQWIPKSPSLANYRIALDFMEYPQAFVNTFSLAVVVSVAQLLACSFIGYGFARFQYPGSNVVFALVIFTLLVPPQMIMVPLFLNFRFFDLFGVLPDPGINLIGSNWPFLMLAFTGTGMRNGLFIYIMRQFFRGFSQELEEAAYVDGAGPLKTFVLVMIPNAVPVMITVFLFAFVWQWNDLFYVNLFLTRDIKVLPFTLSTLANNYQYYMERSEGVRLAPQYLSVINNAGMLLFIAPLIAIYAFLQRYFVESIERSGIVG